MKIRRKYDHSVTAEVDANSPVDLAQFYVRPADGSSLIVYPKVLWEPVPEKQWKDVTAECEILMRERHLTIMHKKVLISAHGYLEDGYRIRKVRLYWAPCMPENVQDAFLIEKEE